MKRTLSLVAGFALFTIGVSAANAGIMFGPSTSSFNAAGGSSLQIPFVVTLTGGTTTADISYAAFAFVITGNNSVIDNLSWSFDPLIGGTAGPVTNSRFFSTPLALGNPTTLFGTLTANLSNVSGTAFITPAQGTGPQWLWQGQNCPSNPDFAPVSVTVPTPGAVAIFGIGGLVAATRRRRRAA